MIVSPYQMSHQVVLLVVWSRCFFPTWMLVHTNCLYSRIILPLFCLLVTVGDACLSPVMIHWNFEIHFCVFVGEALLSFRSAIVSSDGILPLWRPEDTDPCNWRGVTCDQKTKRVIYLWVHKLFSNFKLIFSLFLPWTVCSL
jgi:hypothetical protein